MAIKLYNSTIKDVYAGDNKIKSVYAGDNLVYESIKEDVGSEYNYFVFETSSSTSRSVYLSSYRGGDTTTWDGLTDWGDGTIDSNTSHTYASNGVYTVKTKYMINDNTGYGNSFNMLIKCTGINKNITDMRYMFYKCSSLTSLDISNLDTSNVTNMVHMFNGCTSLTSLDLSNFNTSKVTNVRYMFKDCSKLTSLNLSNFNTSNVTDMGSMFYNCTNLSKLDISNFDTKSIGTNSSGYEKMTYMFHNCNMLYENNIKMTNCSSSTKSDIKYFLKYDK